MKRIILLFVLALILSPSINFAQISDFNLSKLNKVNVVIMGNDWLSSTIQQKLETEIKLKLMSAGIKIVSVEESKAVLIIKCDAIKSNFAEHRILVVLAVTEKVKTERESSPETQAFTYFDHSFYTSKDIEGSIYNTVMDQMIIKFIEVYLSTN